MNYLQTLAVIFVHLFLSDNRKLIVHHWISFLNRSYSVSSMWNSLPSSVVSSKILDVFKALVQITGTEVCVLACNSTASCK